MQLVTDDEGHEQLREKEFPELQEEHRHLRLAVRNQFLVAVLQLLVLLSATIVPSFSLAILVAIDLLVDQIPVITFSPLGISLRGEGVEVTKVVIPVLISLIAKRIYTLNTKGYPRLEFPEQKSPSGLGGSGNNTGEDNG